MFVGFKTDVGRIRKQNEDSVLVNDKNPIFAIVADGMGGHNAGEVASRMAVDVISKGILENTKKGYFDYDDIIRDGFVLANKRIYQYAEENQKLMGMGTTAVVAIIYDGFVYVGNVGDSRAYIVKNNEIKQISIDHSYVWQLVRRGDITEEQAKTHPQRNYITRAMGTEPNIVVDTFKECIDGGTIIVCSDGLTGYVDKSELLSFVQSSDDLEKISNDLVELANSRGGRDNITVALIRDI